MQESIVDRSIVPVPTVGDVLTDVLRTGAQQLLAQAIEAEVADWIDQHASVTDEDGRRLVVRNGHFDASGMTT